MAVLRKENWAKGFPIAGRSPKSCHRTDAKGIQFPWRWDGGLFLEGGSDCLLITSGMAPATAVIQSFLPGDHVVAWRVLYWALRTWLIDFAMSWGLDVEFVDTSNLNAFAACDSTRKDSAGLA